MKKKCCIIYNYAQHYRTDIFSKISEEYLCDFVFGDTMGDVKKMDYSVLQGSVKEVHTIKMFGGWYWQPGVIKKLFADYDYYILLGDTRAVSTWLFCILAIFKGKRKKIYIWTHGWYGKENTLEKMVKKAEFHLAGGGIFLYGNYARQLMVKEGFNPSKLFTIHNSLAYDKQIKIRKELSRHPIYQEHFNNSNYNLFFVGRMTPVKKLDQILYAILKSREKGSIYNLTFIGGGEELESLTQKVEKLGLNNQVWFYGPCYDEKELGKLIYNADLCVAPGNIGLTAMHSLVFGTPCITHDDFPYQMPEFESIIPNKTGCFFSHNDIDDLSDKIDQWFEQHGDDRERVRNNCFKEIDDSWNPYYQIKIINNAFSRYCDK